MNNYTSLLIPLSNSARQYGYITWKKKHDEQIKIIIGIKDVIKLKINDKNIKKRIDWERRRISITYTLTRNLPKDIKTIRLKKSDNNIVILTFEK